MAEKLDTGLPVTVVRQTPDQQRKPLTIRHETIKGGKPVTMVRKGLKETEESRRPEDPEGLRPERMSERGSYRGRWPADK